MTTQGCSLNTLLLKCAKQEPTIFLIKTSKQNIFGAFVTTAWERSTQYRGSGEMFLFTLPPQFKKFPWSRSDPFFMMVEPKSVLFGGGGSSGLYVDDEFNCGYTERCATFDNEPMNGNERDFECVEVEVIGFQ